MAMSSSRITALSVVGVALLCSLTGCFWATTKHEGKKLREDLQLLDDRVKSQEDALGTKVDQLKKVLDEATKLLARNSADLGSEMNGLLQENAKLTGLVMEAKRYADQVRKEAAANRTNAGARVAALGCAPSRGPGVSPNASR